MGCGSEVVSSEYKKKIRKQLRNNAEIMQLNNVDKNSFYIQA